MEDAIKPRADTCSYFHPQLVIWSLWLQKIIIEHKWARMSSNTLFFLTMQYKNPAILTGKKMEGVIIWSFLLSSCTFYRHLFWNDDLDDSGFLPQKKSMFRSVSKLPLDVCVCVWFLWRTGDLSRVYSFTLYKLETGTSKPPHHPLLGTKRVRWWMDVLIFAWSRDDCISVKTLCRWFYINTIPAVVRGCRLYIMLSFRVFLRALYKSRHCTTWIIIKRIFCSTPWTRSSGGLDLMRSCSCRQLPSESIYHICVKSNVWSGELSSPSAASLSVISPSVNSQCRFQPLANFFVFFFLFFCKVSKSSGRVTMHIKEKERKEQQAKCG